MGDTVSPDTVVSSILSSHRNLDTASNCLFRLAAYTGRGKFACHIDAADGDETMLFGLGTGELTRSGQLKSTYIRGSLSEDWDGEKKKHQNVFHVGTLRGFPIKTYR